MGRTGFVVAGVVGLSITSCAGSSSGESSSGTPAPVTTTIETPGSAAPDSEAPDTTANSSTATTTTVPAPVILASAFGEGFSGPTLDELAIARDANDGLLPIQEALDLFASVYGDVPGADGDRFETDPRDGTAASRNVFRLWDELTDGQRAAVLDLLGFDEGPQPRGFRSVGTTRQVETEMLATAEAIRDQIAANVGVALALDLDVDIRTTYPVAGEAIPVGAGRPFSPPFDTCRLVLVVPSPAGTSIETTIAHELFHCFQYSSPRDSDAIPDWIIEGQAQWVGGRLGGPDPDTDATIAEWFGNLGGSLFAKSYDAIGFYYAIEQAGVDPWSVMLGMLGRSNPDAVAATGLTPADAVRWMGTTGGHADLAPTLPVSEIWQIAAWEPNVAVREDVTVTEETPYIRSRSLPAYSAHGAWVFDLEEEIARVDIGATSGALEFFGESPTSFDGSFSGEFCLRPEGCACGPDDAPELLPGSEQMIAAIGSLGGATSISVSVEDIDDGGFAEGHWTGSLTATPITTNIDGGLITRGNPTAAPFEFDVVEGVVDGTYSVAMDQTVDAEDLHAEGVGTVTGAVAGCWFSPRLVAGGYSFRGTATIGGSTVPFNFDVPFDGTEPVGTPTSNATRWDFEVAEENAASGTLPTGVFLDFMRSVGVAVNDVEIRFDAARDG